MIKSKDVTGGGSCFSPAFLLSISFFYHYQNLKEHELKKKWQRSDNSIGSYNENPFLQVLISKLRI